MTDFIVYISAQQGVQANLEDRQVRQPGRFHRLPRVAWPNTYAMRLRVSGALYRLAVAVQPVGNGAGAGASTSA